MNQPNTPQHGPPKVQQASEVNQSNVAGTTLPAYDAWFFALALADRPLTGLAQQVSPVHRPFAERLAQVPPKGRASA